MASVEQVDIQVFSTPELELILSRIFYQYTYVAGAQESLSAVADNNLQNVSWIMPAGIYPPEVFSAGLLYKLAYQTLKNLYKIQTLTTNGILSQLSVPMDDVYIVKVSASSLKSNFGPEASISFTIGKLYSC